MTKKKKKTVTDPDSADAEIFEGAGDEDDWDEYDNAAGEDSDEAAAGPEAPPEPSAPETPGEEKPPEPEQPPVEEATAEERPHVPFWKR